MADKGTSVQNAPPRALVCMDVVPCIYNSCEALGGTTHNNVTPRQIKGGGKK